MRTTRSTREPKPTSRAEPERLGLRARVRDEERSDHGGERRDERDLVPVAHEDEPDGSQHGGLAEPVERRVEERAEDRSLARGPSQRAVEDVGDGAHHEQKAAEPEEELLVALLETDEHGACQAERDARERQHVRGQLRLRDPAHGALEDLPGGLRVLLLDAVELADPRLGRGFLIRHAGRRRSKRVRLSTSPVTIAST